MKRLLCLVVVSLLASADSLTMLDQYFAWRRTPAGAMQNAK